MNTGAQMQALNMIFETIKSGAVFGCDPAVLCSLAACGQTLIYGSQDEHDDAWGEAQDLMVVVAKASHHD